MCLFISCNGSSTYTLVPLTCQSRSADCFNAYLILLHASQISDVVESYLSSHKLIHSSQSQLKRFQVSVES